MLREQNIHKSGFYTFLFHLVISSTLIYCLIFKHVENSKNMCVISRTSTIKQISSKMQYTVNRIKIPFAHYLVVRSILTVNHRCFSMKEMTFFKKSKNLNDENFVEKKCLLQWIEWCSKQKYNKMWYFFTKLLTYNSLAK